MLLGIACKTCPRRKHPCIGTTRVYYAVAHIDRRGVLALPTHTKPEADRPPGLFVPASVVCPEAVAPVSPQRPSSFRYQLRLGQYSLGRPRQHGDAHAGESDGNGRLTLCMSLLRDIKRFHRVVF
jgi:hypothetical protein